MMCFDNSRKLAKIIGDSPKQRLEYFDLYTLKLGEASVNLYVSRKRATKSTRIHCAESGDIIWEQFYLFGGLSRPSREKKYVLKPRTVKNAVTVVLIRGNPQEIIGLDNGAFKSYQTPLEAGEVYLIKENEFTCGKAIKR